ncbi:MAG TPA: hypothetical protein DCX07_13780 [Phycisphaerales bacterium]|nr:hypothetical protein [Phycisphaerales bacterium]HOF18179.1 hypothetical protein [Phycisphaerae bacterium]
MRFIGNNHAIHFGGVTFINRVTLVSYVEEEMARAGKSSPQQLEVARFIKDAVDRVEEELRVELRAKHYLADLHEPQAAKA